MSATDPTMFLVGGGGRLSATAPTGFNEGNAVYPSSIDPITNLFVKWCYPNKATSMPIVALQHGYAEDANAILSTTMRRWAARGCIAAAFGLRGRNGAGGTRDASGRELYDLKDGVSFLRANLGKLASPSRAAVVGYSGGGGNAMGSLCKMPDLFQVATSFFGMSDYGYNNPLGWWYTNPALAQPLLIVDVGDRAVSSDPYLARDAITAMASSQVLGKWKLFLFHDTADGLVSVVNSQRASALLSPIFDASFYSESEPGDPIRWLHGYPEANPDLVLAEEYFAPAIQDRPVRRVPMAGSATVIGWMATSRFEIWTGSMPDPANDPNGGEDRAVTVQYDCYQHTYLVTPLNGPAYVQVFEGPRTASALVTAPMLLVAA